MTYVKEFSGKSDRVFDDINNHALVYGVRILGGLLCLALYLWFGFSK